MRNDCFLGINIILSFVKEYVKLAWEFTGKPGQENWDFWHLKKLKWLKRQENRVHIEVLCILESCCWKVRAGVSGFLTFKKYLIWLKLQECKQFSWFKPPKKYAYQIPLYFRSRCWKPFAHWSEMTASGYTTRHFFQINTPTITSTVLCSSTAGWEDMKNKVIPTQQPHLHQHQHQHQLCLQTGTLHHLCEMSGLIHNKLG